MISEKININEIHLKGVVIEIKTHRASVKEIYLTIFPIAKILNNDLPLRKERKNLFIPNRKAAGHKTLIEKLI